ncbi:MAG TPA: hypothetical protein PKV70_07465 [Thermodesulfobacteriota bacterium]|nr:hypothetical protein [Thermodesulfobacteriota bacterium]
MTSRSNLAASSAFPRLSAATPALNFSSTGSFADAATGAGVASVFDGAAAAPLAATGTEGADAR